MSSRADAPVSMSCTNFLLLSATMHRAPAASAVCFTAISPPMATKAVGVKAVMADTQDPQGRADEI